MLAGDLTHQLPLLIVVYDLLASHDAQGSSVGKTQSLPSFPALLSAVSEVETCLDYKREARSQCCVHVDLSIMVNLAVVPPLSLHDCYAPKKQGGDS